MSIMYRTCYQPKNAKMHRTSLHMQVSHAPVCMGHLCGVHVVCMGHLCVCMWCAWGTYVVCMGHLCGVHVVCMGHLCVCMGHLCGVHGAPVWCACGVHGAPVCVCMGHLCGVHGAPVCAHRVAYQHTPVLVLS